VFQNAQNAQVVIVLVSHCGPGIDVATTSSVILTPSVARVVADTISTAGVKIPKSEDLFVVVLLLIRKGCKGGFRFAKHQLQKDSRGRPDEKATLAQFR
jgi:hypothetical protein